MPKRVPTIGVIVIRDGKRVSPPLNKGFNFTDDEITQINAIHATALRKPINESVEEPSGKGHTSDDAEAGKAPSKAAPDGSKKATAAKGKKAAAATKAKDEDVVDDEEQNQDEDSSDDADEDEDI
jgi:hypothetical protein